jgi:hypothetical protein
MLKHHRHSQAGAWLVKKGLAQNINVANDYLIMLCICIMLLATYIALLPSRMKLEARLVDRYSNVAYPLANQH